MIERSRPARAEDWPALPYDAWKDTYTTLHLWTQIVGKIRVAQTPWLNHSWHVTLYVTRPWPDHLADPVRPAHLSDRLRLHRSRAADPDQRRRRATAAARAEPVADFHGTS